MESITKKPRMVFFQWDHSKLPKFLLLHTQLHVKCLSEFFDVIVISRDCDYQQVCDTYHPDITLFESGYKSSFSKRLKIANTSYNPNIPKIGFHNGDSWCDCRSGFISQMEDWGIETMFSISTTMAEHTPEISENLYVWPNFIDTELFRDYQQKKTIPVLFTGSMISLYPWRGKIYNLLSKYYSSLLLPHTGYQSKSSPMIFGEQYARTINASWFVPACGTVAKEVVRKHFEIPGSMACLITEKSPALEAAGFVDMENCVFADENDVVDKINYLFSNRHKFKKIINAGYELVHSRHTLKQRDQIYQWYKLHKTLKPNEKIVQNNPFEPMVAVSKSSKIKNSPIICNGLHLMLMRQGDEMLLAKKYDLAESLYIQSLNYVPCMPEPKVKLAVCCLLQGKVKNETGWIIQPIQFNLELYGAKVPDPVEWAYFIISLLCQGKLYEASMRAHQFPSINHTELYRVRWTINYLRYEESVFGEIKKCKASLSVHRLPQVSFENWLSKICEILKACQQAEYADKLESHLFSKESTTKKTKKKNKKIINRFKKQLFSIHIYFVRIMNSLFESLNFPVGRNGLPSISLNDYIFRLMRWMRVNSLHKSIIKYKTNISAFLKITKSEFDQTVKNILQEYNIDNLLIIGLSGDVKVESILTQLKFKSSHKQIFIVNTINDSRINSIINNGRLMGIKYHEIKFYSHKTFFSDLKSYIGRVKKENEIKIFDLVMIDNYNLEIAGKLFETLKANLIILVNINNISGFNLKQVLIDDFGYSKLSENSLILNGYAILKNNI